VPAARKKKPWNRVIHRWSGVLLMAPLTIACVTGLILNHTVDLDLSNKHVSTQWVQARYGMSLKGDPQAFGLSGKAYAAKWDGKIFHREKILDDSSELVGAVPLRDGTAVVTADAVHYFGLDGELIETLDSLTLPATPITKAGRTDNLTLALETSSGTFTGDTDLLNFSESSGDQEISWSTSTMPTEADLKKWKTAFSGNGIPLDRLILDLHSGRFFGTIGKWIYDLTVIGVLILSATGFILFLRTRRRAK
jgi:hypothetical protein